MKTDKIIEKITSFLKGVKAPAEVLPPFLLKCVSATRPGLSVYRTVTNIIEDNIKCGIPTGKNPDGSDNKINQYTYNVVKNIFDAIRNDAMVQSSIGSNTVMVQAMGGNAGGPVTCTGYNILDVITKGIIR